jgi:NADH-quinone oxidoreductase subunit J
MAEVLFFIAGIGAIAGAIGVIAVRNAFYSVLALVFHLLSLAALFLLLRAQFVAAAQVVVYAGAVMVLYVFVVAYVGGDDRPVVTPTANLGLVAPLFAAALAAELMIALLGSGLQAVDTDGAPFSPGFGTPGAIGELFLTRFLLPFEVASYLLLVAAVGAVILARRRRGIDTEEDERRTLAVADLFRVPAGVGTQAESVGTRPSLRVEPAVGGKSAEREDERGGW